MRVVSMNDRDGLGAGEERTVIIKRNRSSGKESPIVYCPQCGGEYREGFFTCADCGGALVEGTASLPVPVDTELDTDLVTVLESGDPNEIAFAEAVLSDAGIPFMKAGESLQNLFALGRVGFSFSPIAGPVTFQVREEHAEAAVRILEESVPEEFEASDHAEVPDEH
jgi:hypothetical protein